MVRRAFMSLLICESILSMGFTRHAFLARQINKAWQRDAQLPLTQAERLQQKRTQDKKLYAVLIGTCCVIAGVTYYLTYGQQS